MGLFTCPKRVERDGYLVAFEGEIMSEDDARKRGLLADGAPATHETPKEPKEPKQQPDGNADDTQKDADDTDANAPVDPADDDNAAAESNYDDAVNAPADDDNDGQDAPDAAEPAKKEPVKKATTKATTKK